MLQFAFAFPKEEIVSLIIKRLANDLERTFKFSAADTSARVVAVEGGMLKLYFDSRRCDLHSIAALEKTNAGVSVTRLGKGWVRTVLTMDMPPEVARLLEVIGQISDVIYTLPQIAEDLCEACGITLQENNS